MSQTTGNIVWSWWSCMHIMGLCVSECIWELTHLYPCQQNSVWATPGKISRVPLENFECFCLKNWATKCFLDILQCFFLSLLSLAALLLLLWGFNSSVLPCFQCHAITRLLYRPQQKLSQVPDPSTVLNHPLRMYKRWITLPPVYDSSSSHQTIAFALPSFQVTFSFPPLPPHLR